MKKMVMCSFAHSMPIEQVRSWPTSNDVIIAASVVSGAATSADLRDRHSSFAGRAAKGLIAKPTSA
jgi:hypothetical protein